MALLKFLRRDASPPAAALAGSAGEAVDAVRVAREKARRRLIGSVVLLAVGVIGFPLVFQTQPRPVPVDLPIEIPSKEAAEPLKVPPARGVVAAVPTEAPPAVVSPTPAPVAAVVEREVPADELRRAAPATSPSSGAPLPPDSPASSTPAPPSGERFIVQVGAFAETATVREVRAKVEKLGIKTYAQTLETAEGKRTRVRVGPFASRGEAQEALARIKAAGLPGVILSL